MNNAPASADARVLIDEIRSIEQEILKARRLRVHNLLSNGLNQQSTGASPSNSQQSSIPTKRWDQSEAKVATLTHSTPARSLMGIESSHPKSISDRTMGSFQASHYPCYKTTGVDSVLERLFTGTTHSLGRKSQTDVAVSKRTSSGFPGLGLVKLHGCNFPLPIEKDGTKIQVAKKGNLSLKSYRNLWTRASTLSSTESQKLLFLRKLSRSRVPIVQKKR